MQKLTRVALGVLLAMSLSGVAAAGEPATTGLGQAWPNAVDVSVNPHWHVYVFVLNGVKYIQVNDLNGNVIGAVGTAGGQFITLPIGRYAQYVSTPQQRVTGASAAGAPTTVYQDSSTVLTVTSTSQGAPMINTASASICQDPEQCSTSSP